MKYLRNRVTGAVFPFSEKLAANRKMEPCDLEGRSAFESVEVEPAVPAEPQPVAAVADNEPAANVSSNGIVLSRATKPEMLKYAADNYGAELDASKTAPVLREELKALIESEG